MAFENPGPDNVDPSHMLQEDVASSSTFELSKIRRGSISRKGPQKKKKLTVNSGKKNDVWESVPYTLEIIKTSLDFSNCRLKC